MKEKIDFVSLLAALHEAPDSIKIQLRRSFGRDVRNTEADIFIRAVSGVELTERELWVCKLVTQVYLLQEKCDSNKACVGRELPLIVAKEYMKSGSPRGVFNLLLQLLDDEIGTNERFRANMVRLVNRCLAEKHAINSVALGYDLLFWSSENTHNKWERIVATNCDKSFLN